MNKIRKSIFDISWILIQVGIVWVLSEFCGLKSWYNFCKGILIFFLLCCTILQWFSVFHKKESFFGKSIRKIFESICKPFKGESKSNKGEQGCSKNIVSVILNIVSVILNIVSDVLKVIYISVTLSILIKLICSKDAGWVNTLTVIFVYILLIWKFLKKNQTILINRNEWLVVIVIFILFVGVQVSSFDGFIVPVLITIVIPLVDWYYSESGKRFIDSRNGVTAIVTDEMKMKWVRIKAVTVLFSISLGLVVVFKKICLKDNIDQDVYWKKFIDFVAILDQMGFGLNTLLLLSSFGIFSMMYYLLPILFGRKK